MNQNTNNELIDISLHSHGENGEHIRLTVGDQPNTTVHLSLKEARTLAIALVQSVHRAEVNINLKKAKQLPKKNAHERIVAPVIGMPDSQQA